MKGFGRERWIVVRLRVRPACTSGGDGSEYKSAVDTVLRRFGWFLVIFKVFMPFETEEE